eukprot:TRINITY_DN2424_c0_g4_i1.p4 TRINITY_DN2424_c0_g4~~TRINITY_DN2424_c0_g4_i1.p4  ORF type:complete len:269 (-),score=44.80 TRINITY_DN2424_c0_g4_i1:252-1058(-)
MGRVGSVFFRGVVYLLLIYRILYILLQEVSLPEFYLQIQGKMVVTTATTMTNTNKPVAIVSAQAQIQMLAVQLNAAFEIQVRRIDHTPNQKAWKVQIIWNGQTVANMIDSDRSHALHKANQIALKNVEKLIKPIVQKQKMAVEEEVADVQEGTKLDSFGRKLEEYIQAHPTPKERSTISTQTDATEKLTIPAVKGMSRVESYVEINIADSQPLLKPKEDVNSDSDSSTSEDENNTTLVGMYGMLEKYMTSIFGALPTPYSGSCSVTSP